MTRAVLAHYAIDYRSFDVPVPDWVVKVVGEEYLLSLRLKSATTPAAVGAAGAATGAAVGVAARAGGVGVAVRGHELQQQKRAPVVVSEMLPVFNRGRTYPMLMELGLRMDQIYAPVAVCPGDNPSAFVPKGVAPPTFCTYPDLQLDRCIDMAIRKTRKTHRKQAPDGWFDQFGLERVMLAKWRALAERCADLAYKIDWWCRASANIVVVPSLAFHYHFGVRGGLFTWKSLIDDETNTPKFFRRCYWDPVVHKRYWDLVREAHYYPNSTRTPLIVVIHSYVWDKPGFQNIVSSLVGTQPAGFTRRVVIASIESNLFKQDALHVFPGFHPTSAGRDGWVPSGFRGDPRSQSEAAAAPAVGAAGAGRGAESSTISAAPVVVTLPYPTSMLDAASFSTRAQRPYRIMLQSGPKEVAPIRTAVSEAMERVGECVATWKPSGKLGSTTCVLCTDETRNKVGCASKAGRVGGSGTTGTGADAGSALSGAASAATAGASVSASVWALTVQSTFCLEPPGDTLTRSHLYVAVLGGCIPVIFDGGHTRFEEQDATWWAWRDTAPEALDLVHVGAAGRKFFNYSSFAVVYNAADVLEERRSSEGRGGELGQGGRGDVCVEGGVVGWRRR